MLHMEGSRVSKVTAADPSRLMQRLHLTLEIPGSATRDLAIDLPEEPCAGRSITLTME